MTVRSYLYMYLWSVILQLHSLSLVSLYCKSVPLSLSLSPVSLLQAQIYREDFETERKDREKAHALHVDLEERYQKEFKELKHQFQLVSADCGRLTQQLQSERVEKSKHIEDLRADKNTLQVGTVYTISKVLH